MKHSYPYITLKERKMEENNIVIEQITEEEMSETEKVIRRKNPIHERHKNLCKQLHSVYLAKDSDYGSSYHDTYKKFGITSAAIRISDKYNRMMSLIEKHDAKVKDESLRDTMLDMCGYLLLTIMELDNEAHREKKDAKK